MTDRDIDTLANEIDKGNCRLPPLDVRIEVARYAMLRLLRAEAPYPRLREEWSKLETLLDTIAPREVRAGGDGETRLCYIKRWRTLVRLPVKYADEIVEALRAAPLSGNAGEPVAWRWRNHVGDFDWSEWHPLQAQTPEQFKKQFENGFARGEFELQPLYAAPPQPAPDAMLKAAGRLRQYASVLDSDAYADDDEPNLREDIELVCKAALTKLWRGGLR